MFWLTRLCRCAVRSRAWPTGTMSGVYSELMTTSAGRQPMLADLVAHGAQAHPQQLGRVGPVAGGCMQSDFQQRLLQLRAATAQASASRSGRQAGTAVRGRASRPNLFAIAQGDGAAHGVGQLANIARPAMARKVGGKARSWAGGALGSGKLRRKIFGQLHHVLAALAQGRQASGITFSR